MSRSLLFRVTALGIHLIIGFGVCIGSAAASSKYTMAVEQKGVESTTLIRTLYFLLRDELGHVPTADVSQYMETNGIAIDAALGDGGTRYIVAHRAQFRDLRPPCDVVVDIFPKSNGFPYIEGVSLVIDVPTSLRSINWAAVFRTQKPFQELLGSADLRRRAEMFHKMSDLEVSFGDVSPWRSRLIVYGYIFKATFVGGEGPGTERTLRYMGFSGVDPIKDTNGHRVYRPTGNLIRSIPPELQSGLDRLRGNKLVRKFSFMDMSTSKMFNP